MGSAPRLSLLTGAVLLFHLAVAKNVFGPNTAHTYVYNADVKVGTREPATFASKFHFNGLLKVQGLEAGAIIQLSGVTISVYNGKTVDKENEDLPFFQIPEESEAIYKPFKIVYEDGLVASLETQVDDPEWSKNMKKGIASLLQLDLKKISFDRIQAFHTQENNLYGSCRVAYSIVPHSNFTEVNKFRHLDQCQNFPFDKFSSVLSLKCPQGPGHDPIVLSSSSRVHQEIIVDGENIVINKITASGGMHLSLFGPHGEHQYALTNQKLELADQDAGESLAVEINGEPTTLHYNFKKPSPPGSHPDITLGRTVYDKQKSMQWVHTLLGRIADKLEKSSIGTDDKLIHDFDIQILIWTIPQLDYECLQTCYDKVNVGTSYRDETIRKIFLDVLPLSGSEPAALFIVNLVKEGKLQGGAAGALLNQIPNNIQAPSEKLLEAFEELVHKSWPEEEKFLEQVSALNFGSLVFKTCLQGCKIETLEKYVEYFYQKFRGSEDHEHQMLYLQTLSNIGLGSVGNLLEPVVTGKLDYSHHIRFLAVWASLPAMMTQPDKLYEIYWPLLTDPKEHNELRVAAFIVLLITDQSFGRLLNLYWFMRTEGNTHLYSFYYTSLQSLAKTNNPCYHLLGSHAAMMLPYATPPTSSLVGTGNYFVDYRDQQYGFGRFSQLFTIGDQQTGRPSIFYGALSVFYHDISVDYFELYMKIEGLKNHGISFNDDGEGIESKLSKVISLLTVIPRNSKNLHVEVIIKLQRRTLAFIFLNGTSVAKIASALQNIRAIKKEFYLNYQHVNSIAYAYYTQPTDVGVPAGGVLAIPHMISLRGNFTHDLSGQRVTRHNQFDFKYSALASTSLFVYNPLLDTVHGIYTSRAIAMELPVNNHISFHLVQHHLKFSFSKPQSNLQTGIVRHTKTNVYIEGKQALEYLSKSCPSCGQNELVTKGSSYRTDSLINYFGGYNITDGIFDCEIPHGKSNARGLFRKIFSRENKNTRNDNLSWLYLSWVQLADLVGYSPKPGSCGLIASVGHNENNPVTEVEGVIRIKKEEKPDSGLVMNGGKVLTRFTLTVKKGENIDRLYEINAIYDYEAMFIKSMLKLKAKKKNADGAEYMICMDAETQYPEWQPDLVRYETGPLEINAKRSIVWGPTEGDKCPNDGGAFKAIIKGETTEEQRQLTTSDIYPYNICRAEKGKNGFTGPYTPITRACFLAAQEQQTFRKFSYNIKYANLPEFVTDFASGKLQDALKLLATSSEPIEDEHSHGDDIDIVVHFPVRKQNIKIDLHTAKEHRRYEYDYGEFGINPTLENAKFSKLVGYSFQLGIISSCLVNTEQINTLDNTTLTYHASPCYTLATADCSHNPRFGIFVKKVEGPNPLAVKFYTAEHYMELLPEGDTIHISINGEELPDFPTSYLFPADTDVYDFRILKHDRLIQVDSDTTQLLLSYDGHVLHVIVNGLYRGLTCGLCGNMNGDPLDELTGPQNCELNNSDDLTHAYMLHDDACPAPHHLPSCSSSAVHGH